MVAYYNRSPEQETMIPDPPPIRGYQNSYKLWLLQNRQSQQHSVSAVIQNRYGETQESKVERDIASSPTLVKPQPLLPLSPQTGVSREPIGHNFIQLENNRISAFQRILNKQLHYDVFPQEADLNPHYEARSCCAGEALTKCDTNYEVSHPSHHHLTICVPNFQHCDEITSSRLPNVVRNHKISQQHGYLQHNSVEYTSARKIPSQVQAFHQPTPSDFHQLPFMSNDHSLHNSIVRTQPYGFHCTANSSLPNSWFPRSPEASPQAPTVSQTSSPSTYPVRTESVLCHGRQICTSTGIASNSANPINSANNAFHCSTPSSIWHLSSIQKVPLLATDRTADVTWCHAKMCKVSSSIGNHNHPCILATSMNIKKEITALDPKPTSASDTSFSGSQPQTSSFTSLACSVRNKLEEMNDKVSLAMDMRFYKKGTEYRLEKGLRGGVSATEKRANAIRVSVVVPNSFCRASSSAEKSADDWESNVFRRTRQDSVLRARVLALLWVLLGERHLQEMGFPQEPVHRLLWTTVHVCCSVRGAKSAAAVPLDRDHNCGTDMACFRDHTHRFLEVCAPTREHWKRFGWASLTVDAVMHNIYTEELEPMLRSKYETLPPIVQRAVVYLQRQKDQISSSSSTSTVDVQNIDARNEMKTSCQSPPVKRKRGRPAKITNKIDTGGRIERVMLWRFLLNLLEDSRNAACIDWVKREEGIFRIYNTDWLARQWGRRHGNPRMTYEKMARAMRTYYRTKVLQPVPRVNSNLPRKLVYKFNPVVLQKVAAHAGCYHNAYSDRGLHCNSSVSSPRAQQLKNDFLPREIQSCDSNNTAHSHQP